MLSGRDVKAERVRVGLVQADVAGEQSGLSIHTLIQIERGKITLTQDDYQRIIDTIRRIADGKTPVVTGTK